MATADARAGGANSAAIPLLASFDDKSCKSSKALLLLLVAALAVSFIVFLSLNLNTSTTTVLDPTQLCSTSPNPSSCHAIVAANSYSPTATGTIEAIVLSSLKHLDSTTMVTEGSLGRGVPAVADCTHLLDLSRDRLLAAAASLAAGAKSDARTSLSAAMTFHETCLDELPGLGAQIGASLGKVQDMISAALAVLSSTGASPDEPISGGPSIGYPSWLPEGDRRLLDGPFGADAVVAKDGSGMFSTVQAALDAAPSKSPVRYVIYVKRGTYAETVRVAKGKSNIMIAGDGAGATVITGSLNVVDGSTTFNSATLASDADSLILQDLTVRNTAGPSKGQAVALRVSGDRSVVNRCSLEGYQDTLYSHALRQFYRDSAISGTVDFIFGNSAVVFQNCSLVARKPLTGQSDPITAQGRSDPNQNTGTSIQNCQVIPSADLAPVKASVPTYLGRPWKLYSRTVYLQSFIGDHVAARGWLEWSGTVGLDTLYYAEYANTGPGAGTAARVNWPGYHALTNASDAAPFTVGPFIQGGAWLPSTGVAFQLGL